MKKTRKRFSLAINGRQAYPACGKISRGGNFFGDHIAFGTDAPKATTYAASFSLSAEFHNQDKLSGGVVAERVGDAALMVASLQLLAAAQAGKLKKNEQAGHLLAAALINISSDCARLSEDWPLDKDFENIFLEIIRLDFCGTKQ